MRNKTTDARVAVLRETALFAALSDRELKRVVTMLDEIEVPAGRVLAKEGRPGRECFIIADGLADVTLRDEPLNTLGAGDVFGEMALIDQGPRAATVRSRTPMRLYVMDPRGFSSLLAEHRSVARKILQALVERLRGAESAPTYANPS